MGIPNAMPVRQDLLEPLSYLISKKRMNNDYAKMRDSARERFIGADMCPGAGELAEAEAAASIDTYALAGPIVISLTLSVTGVVMKALGSSGETVVSTIARTASKTLSRSSSKGSGGEQWVSVLADASPSHVSSAC